MEAKNWFKSKTIWFNVLAGIVMIAGVFGFNDFQPSPQFTEGVGVVIAIVNLFLRKKTVAGIK